MRRLRGPWGPPLALGGIGVGLLAVGLWNLNRELRTLDVKWGAVLALLQIAIPALVVIYGAYRLAGSSFNRAERWRVTLFGVAGLVLVGGGVYSTILVRLAEARTVDEPQYVLAVTSGLGAAGGTALGSLSVTSDRDARQAERARDNFELLNSIIRHDILNSMMIIQSRAEFIEAETDDDRVREFADTILTQTAGVVDQVERTRAILQAFRTSDPQLEPIDLAGVLERELDTLRTTYDGVVLDVDLPEEPLYVRADDLVDDVVGNVLANAVEHSDANEPRVSVSTSETAADDAFALRADDDGDGEVTGVVELRIADDGPGVDDDLKDAIFRRDETGLHEDGTGSGFGLFFVDTMMEKYGGEVFVEDNDPRGAVFVFRFATATPDTDEETEEPPDIADVVEVPT
jgi:signal transduction histidine kinase